MIYIFDVVIFRLLLKEMVNCWLILVFLGFGVCFSYGENSLSSDSCFHAFPNIKMICAVPIDVKTGITINECHLLCMNKMNSCITLQYDSYKQICEIFNEHSPLDKTNDQLSIKKLSKRHQLYSNLRRFKRNEDNLVDVRQQVDVSDGPIMPKSNCDIIMLPSIGYSFAVFDSECYKLQLQFDSEVANQLKSAKIQSFDTKSFGTSFVEESPPPNPFQSETVKNLPPNSFQSKTIENPPPLPKPLPVIGRSNLIQPITTSSMILSKAQTTQQIIPILLDCADGSRATISITDGIQVQQQVAFYSLVLEDTDKCLYACRTSADLDGIRLPQQCRSSSYRRSTRQCLFYSDVLKPSGNLDYLPNRDSVYFEKFCIPKREVNVGCDEAVYKYPQNILLGHATEVIDSPNQADCITKCITSQQRYKFACKSVMYFHMFDKFNCILNEHDKDSKPEFMHTELRQQVDFIKISSCMAPPYNKKLTENSILSTELESIEWTEWTACTSSLSKTRTRLNCGKCDKKIDVMPCMDSGEFKKNFEKMMANNELYDDEVPKLENQ